MIEKANQQQKLLFRPSLSTKQLKKAYPSNVKVATTLALLKTLVGCLQVTATVM
jgi:predicted dinucleotide-utilizing enzyme